MNLRSLSLTPKNPRAVAMVSEVEGVFVVEPMRFLWPSEARKETRAKNRQIPWCPDEYLALYRSFRLQKHLTPAEARHAVEQQIEKDRKVAQAQ